MFKYSNTVKDLDALHVIGGGVTDFFIDHGITALNIYGDDELISLVWSECYWRKIKVLGCYGEKDTEISMYTGEKNRSQILQISAAPLPEDIPAIIISSVEKRSEKWYRIGQLINYSRQKKLLIEPLYNYVSALPNIKVVLFNLPRYQDIKNKVSGDDNLRNINKAITGIEKMRLRRSFLSELYGVADYGDSIIRDGSFETVKNESGIYFLKDKHTKYVNVKDGYRVVPERPSKYKKRILTFGNSLGMGFFCDDDHTMQNALQKRINGYDGFNGVYGVVNVSNGGYPNYNKMFKSIEWHKPSDEDIIVIIDWINPLLWFNAKYRKRFVFCDPQKENGIFEPPHDLGKYIYIDDLHVNFKAYYKLGDSLADVILPLLKNKKE